MGAGVSPRVTRPKVHAQGRVIVEPGDRGDVLVVMPDGSVEVKCSTSDAATAARAWIKKHMDPSAVNVATIDWRGGLTPG